MTYARSLRRQINEDLVAQIEAHGRVRRPVQPKSKRTPRAAATYRGAKRNAVLAVRAQYRGAKRNAVLAVRAQQLADKRAAKA